MSVKSIQLFLVTSFMLTLAFSSCQKEKNILSVDKKEITLSTEKKEDTFNVTTNGVWSIAASEAHFDTDTQIRPIIKWWKISSAGGVGKVAITVSLNENDLPGEDRTLLIAVIGENNHERVTVKFKK